MQETTLYRKIMHSIRQQIIDGLLKPGDRLPSIRQMAVDWGCTQGTIQRAYKELSTQGLVISRAGQGSQVIGKIEKMDATPLRRAMLVHRAEAFLLEVLTAGYTSSEIEQAVRMAMDRWRAVENLPPQHGESGQVRFTGSHDVVVDLLASQFEEIAPGFSFLPQFSGSLGGLIALAENKADLAGSHLWDEKQNSYNTSFVERLLPGKHTALVTLAHRHLGITVPAGNPLNIQILEDLVSPKIHFINRQSGSGTRVWLDAQLHALRIDPNNISGYKKEATTHTDVARAIAEKRANAGLCLESIANAYGLDFIFLTKERYDLIIPAQTWETTAIQSLITWLNLQDTHAAINALGGYDSTNTGNIVWVG